MGKIFNLLTGYNRKCRQSMMSCWEQGLVFKRPANKISTFKFVVKGYRQKFEARPKLKVGGGCFWAHMYAYNVFFEKNLSFGSFINV
jgi:hypothetical protein